MMMNADALSRLRALVPAYAVVDDPDLITPWLTDWRHRYTGVSPVMLAPRSTIEVATMIGWAREFGVPLVPQGGNTSMVGGATPPADGSGLILSLRGLNQIRSIDQDARLAICEAGVILTTLHDAADAKGLRFPLSLGARGSATVGGLVSTNAGGTQVLRHGTMRALVEGLEIVMPDGSVHEGLAALKKDNRGYDLKHLVIGAEGTLGIVTAAALRLVPAIADRAVGWAALGSPHDALVLLRRLEDQLGPVLEGFEVIAGDTLGFTLGVLPGARSPVATSDAPWHVLIEVALEAGALGLDARTRLESALAYALEDGLLLDATVAVSEQQAQNFWRLREAAPEGERSQGPALQFDVSVPVAAMPDFMVQAVEACETAFRGTSASSFGHLGDGNIHFHVRAPKVGAEQWLKEYGEEVIRFVHDRVVAAGGSLSAEHGIGQYKIEEFARLSSPARLNALRAIKTAMDPQGLFNPGKLVPLATKE
jgi:FAD/FMN-containing dehydrogenase